MVLGVGMGVGVAAAEVVSMNEKKGGGTHRCPRHHLTHRRGVCGRGRGRGCGCRRQRRHGSGLLRHASWCVVWWWCVMVVVGWVVRLNKLNVGSNLVTRLVT